MEGEPDTVTADLFNDRVAVCLGVGVDRVSDISKMSPWSGSSEPEFYALFCHTD